MKWLLRRRKCDIFAFNLIISFATVKCWLITLNSASIFRRKIHSAWLVFTTICYNHTQIELTEWVKCKNCVVSDMRQQVERWLDHESVELTLSRLSQFFEGWFSFYIERVVSLMKMIVFNFIQVINYWFTLHCILRLLYQQAQIFNLNIQGISDQNITLWTLLWYKNDNQCAKVSFDKLSQPSRPSANDQCTQGISTQCVHRWEREAVSLLDQAWVIYWIQSGKVQVQDEQRSVYCIVPQECSIWLS